MNKTLILAAMTCLAFTGVVTAQTLTGTTTAITGNTSLSGAFVAYTSQTITDPGNIANFIGLTPVAPATGIQTHGIGISVTCSGVLIGTSTPASATANYNGQQSDLAGSGENDGFSLTSTVFATSETFNFYLEHYDTATTITVGLGDGTLTPDLYVDTIGTNLVNSDVKISLALTNLTVGDTATFTFTTGAHSANSYPTETILCATAISDVSAITLSTNTAGAIVGSNAVVILSVPSSFTASGPGTVTLTSANTAVTASQTITLPMGLISTNLSFPILGVGSSTVTATAPGLSFAVVTIGGALPTIVFTPQAASAAVGTNASSTMTLTCPYPFSGPYTLTVTSDNPGVAANQTVTLPAGVAATNLSFPVLTTGFANLTATGSGLNSSVFLVGTVPQIFSAGLNNQWVGDTYTTGNNWIDSISGVIAALDGNPAQPLSVSGIFGPHKGVQRDPAGTYDAGFDIPGNNAPTGYSNYMVSAVIYPTSLTNGDFEPILGYDIAGTGQPDWSIIWEGNGTGGRFISIVGLGNGGDETLISPSMNINSVYALALQVRNGTISMYVNGNLVQQGINLPVQAPDASLAQGVIPMLSDVGLGYNADIFTGPSAEVRIYTNSLVDGAALTTFLANNYSYSTAISINPNSTGAVVGSNAVVTLSVPVGFTASSSATITLTSGNSIVTTNQTVILPIGVTSTYISFPILAVGESTVTATTPGLNLATVNVSGVLPTINFAPPVAIAPVGGNATSTLTLACQYPFKGAYAITLTSDTPGVAASQTVTLPLGIFSTNLTFPVLASGEANLTATGSGLNQGIIVVTTFVSSLTVTNGDFEIPAFGSNSLGQSVGGIGVSNWFSPTAAYEAWQTGSGRVVQDSQAVEFAPATGWIYQPLGTYYPNNGTNLSWSFQQDTDLNGGNSADFSISFYYSAGAFTPAQGTDINGASGVTLIGTFSFNSLYADGLTNVAGLQSDRVNFGLQSLSSVPKGDTVWVHVANTGVDGPNGGGYAPIDNFSVNQTDALPAPSSPTILPVNRDSTGTNLVIKVATQSGYKYYLLSTTNLTSPVVWTTNSTTPGTGGIVTNTLPISSLKSEMFYRYLVQ